MKIIKVIPAGPFLYKVAFLYIVALNQYLKYHQTQFHKALNF